MTPAVTRRHSAVAVAWPPPLSPCRPAPSPSLRPPASVRLRPPVVSGSFDHTTKVWDAATGRCLHTLSGHRGEISSTAFDFSGDLCITGSIDRTCKVDTRLAAAAARRADFLCFFFIGFLFRLRLTLRVASLFVPWLGLAAGWDGRLIDSLRASARTGWLALARTRSSAHPLCPLPSALSLAHSLTRSDLGASLWSLCARVTA